MTDIDADQDQTASLSSAASDSPEAEIARLKGELTRTKQKLLVALDAVAGAEAETAEAKGKALEFLREIQARNADLQELSELVPELRHQADLAHEELAELKASRTLKVGKSVLRPYQAVRGRLGE